MARQCPYCGENNLREKAHFCDKCGSKLAVMPDDTLTRPEATTLIDDGLTRAIPESGVGLDEGLTRAMPETETLMDDGLTRSIPQAKMPVDDGLTRRAPEDRPALEDGSTRLMPEAGDGSTRPMPEEDEAQTKAVPTAKTEEQTKNLTLISETRVAGTKEELLTTGAVVQLHGRYQLIKILGKGGFGAAYLAEDIKLKRRCVVKQMLVKHYSSRDLAIYRANFEREAKLLVELNDPGHPSIPEIYDYFSEDDSNYLVMKYIEGRNLKDVLEQSEHQLPWREAIRYTIEICSALHYMHTKGREPVMHRDIKPANILLGDDGRVWLVDFGLAKANPVKGSDDPLATQALGTLGYTPLEQWLGEGPYFEGARFSLVDAVFGPVFRYFDTFDRIADFGMLAGKPKIAAWRRALARRPSIARAVAPDYPERLWEFLRTRNSRLSALMTKQAA